jgi:hypothetical protein
MLRRRYKEELELDPEPLPEELELLEDDPEEDDDDDDDEGGGELELPVEEPPVEVEDDVGAEVVGGGAKLATLVRLLPVRLEPGYNTADTDAISNKRREGRIIFL